MSSRISPRRLVAALFITVCVCTTMALAILSAAGFAMGDDGAAIEDRNDASVAAGFGAWQQGAAS